MVTDERPQQVRHDEADEADDADEAGGGGGEQGDQDQGDDTEGEGEPEGGRAVLHVAVEDDLAGGGDAFFAEEPVVELGSGEFGDQCGHRGGDCQEGDGPADLRAP